MNKINIKQIMLLCVGLISLVVCIIFSSVIQKPGFDYTKEYQIYQDIGSMTSLKDVEQYLDNMNIEHEIEASKLTLPDYNNIKYMILSDNISGYILHSSSLHTLSLLDERDLEIVTVEKTYIDNNIAEIIYIEEDGITYTKIEDKYYIEPTGFYIFTIILSFFASIIILSCSIADFTGILFDWLKKRQDAKKLSATVADTNSENETKES